MTHTEELAGLVEDQKVEVINIVAVPRSMSTALGRLLCQGSETTHFINEPFNRNNLDPEVAACNLLATVNPQLEAAAGKTLTVVTKNMATYLTEESFDLLNEVSAATIWSVRHPFIQIGSLLTRMLNDMEFETGASAIEQDGMLEQIDRVCSRLERSEISSNFSRTGWSSLMKHFRSRGTSKPTAVVDGTEMTTAPEIVITHLCDVLGIRFNRSMIEGWTKGYDNLNTGSSRFDTTENAWTRDAANSDAIKKNDRAPLDPESLPESLRAHIYDVALPAYAEIKGDS